MEMCVRNGTLERKGKYTQLDTDSKRRRLLFMRILTNHSIDAFSLPRQQASRVVRGLVLFEISIPSQYASSLLILLCYTSLYPAMDALLFRQKRWESGSSCLLILMEIKK